MKNPETGSKDIRSQIAVAPYQERQQLSIASHLAKIGGQTVLNGR
jgi:hypothetical protein